MVDPTKCRLTHLPWEMQMPRKQKTPRGRSANPISAGEARSLDAYRFRAKEFSWPGGIFHSWSSLRFLTQNRKNLAINTLLGPDSLSTILCLEGSLPTTRKAVLFFRNVSSAGLVAVRPCWSESHAASLSSYSPLWSNASDCKSSTLKQKSHVSYLSF